MMVDELQREYIGRTDRPVGRYDVWWCVGVAWRGVAWRAVWCGVCVVWPVLCRERIE